MTALSLIDPASGEIVKAVDAHALLAAAGLHNLPDADTVTLAEFTENAAELRSIASEATTIVGDELIRRLDARAKWTLREGGWEIKTQSPEAGTTAYHTGLLRQALLTLVEDDIISPEGSSAALERVEHSTPIPYWLLREIAKVIPPSEARNMVGDMLGEEPAPQWRQHAAGIKALLKIPGARDLITDARIPVLAPRRTARVRRTA